MPQCLEYIPFGKQAMGMMMALRVMWHGLLPIYRYVQVYLQNKVGDYNEILYYADANTYTDN